MDQTWFEKLRRRCVQPALVLGLALLFFNAVPASLGAQVPPNDLCADAISIDCSQNPFGTAGNNENSSETGAPFCGTSPGSHAVWYAVMGNGFDIQIDTCSPNTNFDTRVTIYTDNSDCADEAGMSCIGGNDDAAGMPPECELGSSGAFTLSRTSWTSVAGVEYLVVVSGFGALAGDFELILTCEVPVELQRFTIE